MGQSVSGVDSFMGNPGSNYQSYPTPCQFCRFYPATRECSMPTKYDMAGIDVAFENPQARMTLTRCCQKSVHTECSCYVRIHLTLCPICKEEIMVPLSPLLEFKTPREELYKIQLFELIAERLTPEAEKTDAWYWWTSKMTSSDWIELVNLILNPPVSGDDGDSAPELIGLDEQEESENVMDELYREQTKDKISDQVTEDQESLKRMLGSHYPYSPRKYEALSHDELLKKVMKLKAEKSDLEWTNHYLRSTVLL